METVARLVPPAVVPGWITEGVGDYTRMFHGAFDFASPDATYNRCDDIAGTFTGTSWVKHPRPCTWRSSS